jgi:hypothetical protein
VGSGVAMQRQDVDRDSLLYESSLTKSIHLVSILLHIAAKIKKK